MWRQRFLKLNKEKTENSGVSEHAGLKKKDYIQLILVGNAGCGKTSLMNRYCRGQFDFDGTMTIGCDITYKSLKIDERSFTIQVWDTAGQERYDHCLGPMFYRDKKGVILVYEDGNKESLRELQRTERWLGQIQEQSPDAVMYLVAAQCDKEEKSAEAELVMEEAQTFAETLQVPFHKTSAKTGQNVERVFGALVADIIQKFDLFSTPLPQEKNADGLISLGGDVHRGRLNCCSGVVGERRRGSSLFKSVGKKRQTSPEMSPADEKKEKEQALWSEIISVINECEECDEPLLSSAEIESLFEFVKKHDTTLLEMYNACHGVSGKKRMKRFARNAKRLLSEFCVICDTEAPEISFFPCGHLCTCANCCNELMETSKQCPICRNNIQQFAKAYI